MTSHNSLRRDSRGLSTPITHTLSIAITALLIITLIAGVTGALEQRSEAAATEELRTIGHKVATQFQALNASAGAGGNVSYALDLPADVVGRSYSIRLVPASECSSGAYSSSPDVCLRLSASGLDIEETIPIQNSSSTRLDIDSSAGGTFVLSATGTGSTTFRTSAVSIDQTVRVGVTNVRRLSGGGVVNFTNAPPVPAISVSPDVPYANQTVVFDASAAKDDRNIVNFTFVTRNVTNATVNETTLNGSATPVIPYTPDDGGGRYSVTLYVTDSDDVTASATREFKVSGLKYNRDYTPTDFDGDSDNEGFEFSVTNNWSHPINITGIYLEPEDGSSSPEIDNAGGGDPEITVDAPTYDGFVNFGNDGDPDDKSPDIGDGFVVDMDAYAGGGGFGDLLYATGDEPRLGEDESATFEIGQIDGLSKTLANVDWNVSIRYVIDRKDPVSLDVEDATPWSTQIRIDNGGADIDDFRIQKNGSDLDVAFRSSQRLSDIGVDAGSSGTFSTSLSTSEFTETPFGTDFRYAADLTSSASGVVWANLSTAENTGGMPSSDIGPGTGTNDSVFVSTSGYGWTDIVGNDPRSLMAYYPFNESGAEDASVNTYDGSLTGSDIDENEPGKVGDAYDFDDDWIEVDSLSDALEGKDAVTVTAWLESDDDSADNGIFTTDGDDGSDDDFELRYDDEGASFSTDDGFKGAIRHGSGRVQIESGNNVQTTNWQHVAFRWSAGTAPEVFTNGSLLSTAGVNGSPDPSHVLADLDKFRIGGPIKSGDPWDGKIDEFRVYDEALSASQIQRIANFQYGNTTTYSTSWEAGSAIQPDKLAVDYRAAIEYGEVEVRVQADPDGDNVSESASDWKDLSDGSGTVDWTASSDTSIGSTGNRLRVQVRITREESALGPAVGLIQIREV